MGRLWETLGPNGVGPCTGRIRPRQIKHRECGGSLNAIVAIVEVQRDKRRPTYLHNSALVTHMSDLITSYHLLVQLYSGPIT